MFARSNRVPFILLAHVENGIDPLEKGKRIVEKKSDAREREGGGGIDPSRFYAAFTLGARRADRGSATRADNFISE